MVKGVGDDPRSISMWNSLIVNLGELVRCMNWKGELTGTLTWATDTFLDLKYMHWIHSCLFIFKNLMNRIMEKIIKPV